MYRFQFNLLPQKSIKQIKKEEKRDSTSLYLALLPLLSVIVAIGLLFINKVVLEDEISDLNKKNGDRDIVIESYRNIVARNLEVVDKSYLLEDQVLRDVDPSRFFSLAEDLLSQFNFDAQISRYGREDDGTYNIELIVSDISFVPDVMRVFESLDNVYDPAARSINVSDISGTRVLVNFNLLVQDDLVDNE